MLYWGARWWDGGRLPPRCRPPGCGAERWNMREPSPPRSFGSLLKQYRRAAGFTQAALAEQAGYSTVYIGKLEEGERWPLGQTIDVLADALHLSPSERAALEAAARQRPSSHHAHRASRAGRPRADSF